MTNRINWQDDNGEGEKSKRNQVFQFQKGERWYTVVTLVEGQVKWGIQKCPLELETPGKEMTIKWWKWKLSSFGLSGIVALWFLQNRKENYESISIG